MPLIYKSLVVVFVVTALMFAIARPLMRRFMSDADFSVRRNVWLGLTLAAFLIPNYWGYVVVASVILIYGVVRDRNPAALYVFLLLAMVPIGLSLPTLGVVKELFQLDHLRLLALVVLLPVAIGLARSAPAAAPVYGAVPRDRSRFHADLLILAYAGLQIVLLAPYEAPTATLRRLVLIAIDLWLPYYVLSRGCRSREQLVEVMAAFALSMFLLVPLAVFEVVKGWLLYAGLQDQWGTDPVINYLRRGHFLRAQLMSGHSIVLGYAMSTAFGLWLYLQTRVESKGWRVLALLTLLVGMAMPSARGPWLGAVLMLLIFLALGPNRASRMFKAIGFMALLVLVVLVSPLGDQIVERLPFVGTIDVGTVSYRQELAAMSWQLIQHNPWFGTPGFIAYLEDLRQGQGIIDLVNAYAGIALAYGLVTLAAFFGFFGLIVSRCIGTVRALASADHDLSLLGASLVACIVGGLFMIATVNLYLSVADLTWSLAGMGVAYLVLARGRALESAAPPPEAVAPVWQTPGYARPIARRLP